MSNATDNHIADDKELNEYLGGNTEFSRRYRALAADTVPTELDALVLAQADARVVPITKTEPLKRKSLGLWMRISVPVALAASFVFAISIMLENSSKEVRRPATLSDRQPPKKTAPINESVDNLTVEEERSVASTVPAAPQPVAANKPKTLSKATAPERMRSASNTPQQEEAKSNASEEKLDAVVVTGQVVKSLPQETALPISVITTDERSAPAPTLARSSAAPPAAATSAAKEEPKESARGLEEVLVTGNYLSRGERKKQEAATARLEQEKRQADPVAWLEYIRQLRSAGKQRDANREWKNFVKAFPNYTVEAHDAARPLNR